MDIPALSMHMAQTQVMSDIGTALLSNALDQAATQGNAVAQMLDSSALEHSVSPELGGTIDIRI